MSSRYLLHTPLTFSFIRTVYENVYIELCKIFNVKKETIEFYASPTKLKRNRDNGYVVVRIDDEREE